MIDFKAFIRAEMHLIPTQLEDLLLLHPEEDREDIVPRFQMRRIQVTPGEITRGWNFPALILSSFLGSCKVLMVMVKVKSITHLRCGC